MAIDICAGSVENKDPGKDDRRSKTPKQENEDPRNQQQQVYSKVN